MFPVSPTIGSAPWREEILVYRHNYLLEVVHLLIYNTLFKDDELGDLNSAVPLFLAQTSESESVVPFSRSKKRRHQQGHT